MHIGLIFLIEEQTSHPKGRIERDGRGLCHHKSKSKRCPSDWLTRGQETKFNHLEKLDRGEVMIAQFTEYTSAIKIRGPALIYTKHGIIDTEQ